MALVFNGDEAAKYTTVNERHSIAVTAEIRAFPANPLRFS
jgi:hypothetical protein